MFKFLSDNSCLMQYGIQYCRFDRIPIIIGIKGRNFFLKLKPLWAFWNIYFHGADNYVFRVGMVKVKQVPIGLVPEGSVPKIPLPLQGRD